MNGTLRCVFSTWFEALNDTPGVKSNLRTLFLYFSAFTCQLAQRRLCLHSSSLTNITQNIWNRLDEIQRSPLVRHKDEVIQFSVMIWILVQFSNIHSKTAMDYLCHKCHKMALLSLTLHSHVCTVVYAQNMKKIK